MDFGVYSFAETPRDPQTGLAVDPGVRLRNLLEEIEVSDRLGLDVFGVGEHHRPDFAASSPAVILAAAGARTSRIKLGSAVTVLSSADPVRVYQDFATLDLMTKGRAEIIVGRGSFIESFPLFGQDLSDYNSLFSENLELLLEIRALERVTWRGGHRAAISDRGVYPRTRDDLPIWIAIGGTPESAVRAGTLGLPLALAIIGGMPERFKPLIDLYRESARLAGQPESRLQVAINVHGFVADTATAAAEIVWPAYSETMGRIGRERGWPPPTRGQYEASLGPRGSLFVGGPREVADKILFLRRIFQMDRFVMQFTVGAIAHDKVLRALELFATEVVPLVREGLAVANGEALLSRFVS